MGLALRGRTAEGRAALDEAGRLLSEVNPLTPAAQSISLALGGRLCTGQEAMLREEAASLAAAAREAGAIGLFPYYQLLVADAAYRPETGRRRSATSPRRWRAPRSRASSVRCRSPW